MIAKSDNMILGLKLIKKTNDLYFIDLKMGVCKLSLVDFKI